MGKSLNTDGYDCILFSTADWDEPYWTNKQHTTMELMRHNWRILYIESVGLRSPNFQSKKDWSRLITRLFRGLMCLVFGARKVDMSVYVLSPLMIPGTHHFPLFSKFNNYLLKFSIKRHCRSKRKQKSIVWSYHPYIHKLLDGLSFDKLIYHNVDDISVVPGIDGTYFRRQEDALIKKADVVFTTMETLKERCIQLNPRTYFHPNVVDFDHFSKASMNSDLLNPLKDISGYKLIYHGVLSEFKLNIPLLLEMAKLRSDLNWVFIGEEREGQNNATLTKLAQLPNVHLLGYRPYEELPAYLNGAHIGLLPSLVNDYTNGMFPMKYFEYIASGLRIVSTPLAFTKTHREGLEIGDDAQSFLKAVDIQLQKRKFNVDESRLIVGDNSWQMRTKKMLSILEEYQ
ncbi:MAG: glycosyltransferase [Lentilitoribacter sp.]